MKKKKKEAAKPANRAMPFAKLRVGDHFMFGEAEHVRLPIVEVTGGYFNAAQVGTGTVSGFGPTTEVVRIHHEKKDYNGFFFE